MKSAAMLHILLAGLLVTSGLAIAEPDGDVEKVHQLLDRIEKAYADRDLDRLLAAYSDEGLLAIVSRPDHPDGAVVATKAAMPAALRRLWETDGLIRHLFTDRFVAIRGDMACIATTAVDRYADRRETKAPLLILAICRNGVWRVCLGMPQVCQSAVLVTAVTDTHCGLQIGDVVTACKDRPVHTTSELDAARKAAADAGEPTIALTVKRGTETPTVAAPVTGSAFTTEDRLVPANGAVLLDPDKPHPLTRLYRRSVQFKRENRMRSYYRTWNPNGVLTLWDRPDGVTEIATEARLPALLETRMAEARKLMDMDALQVSDLQAIVMNDVAVISCRIHTTMLADARQDSLRSTLEVYTRHGARWHFTARFPWRVGIGLNVSQPGDLTARQTRDASRGIRGTFAGIGIEMSEHADGALVKRLLPGGAAETGGLAAGEVILAVDGQTVAGLSSAQISQRIIGVEGTPVGLTVRAANGQRRTVSLTRRTVVITGVQSRMLEGRVGLIGIRGFTEQTPQAVREAIDQLQADGATGLVLDLRANTGGPMNAVVAVIELLVANDPPQILWIARYQNGDTPQLAKTPAATRLPVVVLADKTTAGGAELVAAALKEAGRAKVLGSPTAGAAAIKRRVEQPGGGSRIETIGQFYFPSTRSTGSDGITPDVNLPVPSSDQHAYERAAALLKVKSP